MEDKVVELRGVTKIYGIGRVRVVALHNINLDIWKGEFLVVLGLSGSGKSTLLCIIGGIERPTSGRVIVNGVDLTQLSDRELTRFRRRVVGFAFQFFNLIPTLTAKENVMLALELRGLKGKEAEEEALRLLSQVGLEERAEHFPFELSGGEQQRVAIARALVKNSFILLCDEPIGELDVNSGKRVLAILKKFSEEERRTVVLVTHNTAIAKIATRVTRLGNGEVSGVYVVRSPIDINELTW